MMYELGKTFGESGWTLYSGGAEGADVSFEQGCDKVNGKKMIWLPWHGFNWRGRYSCVRDDYDVSEPSDDAIKLASDFHPAWDKLSYSSQQLMARNTHQIFGHSINQPDSKLVICWTPKGDGEGGTGQALRLARHFRVPIIDIGLYDDLDDAWEDIKLMRLSLQEVTSNE